MLHRPLWDSDMGDGDIPALTVYLHNPMCKIHLPREIIFCLSIKQTVLMVAYCF